MLLTESDLSSDAFSNSIAFERVFSKVFQKKDDLSDSDVLAFSALNGEGAASDDGVAFSSGGAIMDALVQKDPSLKGAVTPKPKATAKKAIKPKKAINRSGLARSVTNSQEF